jgi:hypothetical protein
MLLRLVSYQRLRARCTCRGGVGAGLDNPKAISTQPAAAGALLNALNLLHKSAAAGSRSWRRFGE